MYIETLKIKGFKSFRGVTTVSFDRRFNIIVGKKGSGKSSLFYALSLVLGAALPRGADKKQALISNDCDKAVISILINNESGRFPVATSKFTISRSFSPKDDDDIIKLNKDDIITLFELKSMLESSGFPVHPHYLTDSAKTKGSFELRNEMRFKELKKAMCFIRRKSVNKKILEYSKKNKHMNKTVDDDFRKWNTNLKNGSDPDNVALKKFRYFILKNKLQILEKKKLSLSEVLAIPTPLGLIKDKEETLKIIKEILKNLEENIEETDNLIISNNIDKVTFSIDDLESKINCAVANKTAILQRQNDDISDLNNFIELVYFGDIYNLNCIKMELCVLYENIRMIASGEQGEIRTMIDASENRITELITKISEIEESIKDFDASIKTLNKSSEENKHVINKIDNELAIKQFDYEQLVDKMKRLQRDSEELNCSKMVAKNKLISIELLLFLFHYQKHLQVQDILKSLKLKGVEDIDENCLVIDKLKCLDEECEFAVEAVGGNQLFRYILSTNTQFKHLNCLYSDSNFSVGVYVLDNIEEQQSNFQLNDAEMRPLLECISCDEKCQPVFQLIFGKVVLCRNGLPSSAQAIRTHLDYVTYNGDIMFSSGLVKSNYKSESRSKIRLQDQRASLMAQIEKLDEHLNKNTNNFHKYENAMNVLKQETIELEPAKAQLKEEVCVAVGKMNLLNLDLLKNETDLKNENILSMELTLILEIRRAEIDFDEILSEIDKLKEMERRGFSKWENTSQCLLTKQKMLRQSSNDNIAININIEENIRNHRAILPAYQHQLANLEKAKNFQEKLSLNEGVKELLKTEPNLELSITALKDKLRIYERKCQDANMIIDIIQKEINDTTAEMWTIENNRFFDSESQPLDNMPVEELWRNYEALSKKIEESQFRNTGTISQYQSSANYVGKSNVSFELVTDLHLCTAELNKMKEAFGWLKRMFERIANDMLLNYQSKLVFLFINQNDGRVTFKFAKRGNFDYNLSLNSLSVGERATVFLSLKWALLNCSRCSIYMLDEADKYMDEAALQRFKNLLRNKLSESSTNQFIISTLHEEMFSLSGNCIKVFMDEMQSNVSIIGITEASEIIAEMSQGSESIADVNISV